MRLREIAQLQFVGLLQAVALFGMIFHQNAAGVRIADVENNVDVHRRRLLGGGLKMNIAQVELLAEQLQQVQVVCLIFELAQRLRDRLLAAVADAVAERLAQPAVDPDMVEELAQLVVVPGEREGHAVLRVGGGQA